MDKDHNKFLYILFTGVFLLSACIIGTCISSTSIYGIKIIQNSVLLVPYIISYAFIIVGILGYFDIINLLKKRIDKS